MDSLQEFFTKTAPIIGIILSLSAMIFVLEKSGILTRALKITRFMFYSESDFFQTKKLLQRINILEGQISQLRKASENKSLETQRKAIEQELELQLTQNFPALVRKKLTQLKELNTSIDSDIRLAVEAEVIKFLNSHEPTKLLEDRREQLRASERSDRGNTLERTIQEQMQSVGRLKAVMINLFVMVNIGILLIYLFAGTALTSQAVSGIVGLYISLAAFIVYIYRTSNFRSAVLLALREDAKKYYDADDYIKRLKPGASPSDRDIEVLKLLLLNRTEREKMAHHPYELILKGVNNSNIQLKGGKMISASKTEKAPKAT
ncbi:hypothetical protein [Pseudomonas moraviensis]